jgi:hypothetical protein
MVGMRMNTFGARLRGTILALAALASSTPVRAQSLVGDIANTPASVLARTKQVLEIKWP